jgi:hypothetical protein
MRRSTPREALILAELAVGALALFYYFALRVRVLAAFDAYGTSVPPLTGVALSRWFIPGALTIAGALTLAALALPLRRSHGLRLFQLAVTILASAVVFAVLAALVPIFRP